MLTLQQDLTRPSAAFQALLAILLLLALALAYLDTFQELWYYWTEGYNWQFLIPVALVYMLWERRDIFYRLEYRPNVTAGSLMLAGSCLLLAAGQVSSTHIVREAAIIGTAFSLSVLLLGASATRKLFWPLAYLVLMTSIPTEALERLRDPLKLISATVSANVLQSLGYAVYREDNLLYLPHITLKVADECSGVNQLTSSIALGIPIAFTILNRWWKRLLIIAVSIFFGIAMNWVRVILISLWHYDSAKESIHGPQDIYGLPFIFLVGLFITLVIAFAIAEKRPSSHLPADLGNQLSPLSRISSARGFTLSLITGLLIAATTAIYLQTWKPTPMPPSAPLNTFPLTLAGFQGERLPQLDPPFYSGLADDEFIAQYRSPAGEKAFVYLGYFRSQSQEKELVDYRYNWLHEGAQVVALSLPQGELRAKRVLVRPRHLPVQKTVYFTYRVNGRNLVDLKRLKLASLIDSLRYRRNNGGIVVVAFDGVQERLSQSEEAFLKAAMEAAWERLP